MLTISKKLFGTIDKEPVYLFTLSHPAGLRVSVCNYGGIIQSILVPHSDTSLYQEIVLGYDTLDEYLSNQLSFGATIGPIADIIKGASFVLEHNIVCWEKMQVLIVYTAAQKDFRISYGIILIQKTL